MSSTLRPGSWLSADDPQIPDEVPHGCAVWVENGRIVIEEEPMVSDEEDLMVSDDEEAAAPVMARRIGPRMRAIRDYVAVNPGASLTEVVYATHLSPNRRWIGHPTHRKAVYRAEAAGLIVIDRRQRNRYRIYDAELADLEARREAARDEYWRSPAHP